MDSNKIKYITGAIKYTNDSECSCYKFYWNSTKPCSFNVGALLSFLNFQGDIQQHDESKIYEILELFSRSDTKYIVKVKLYNQ